jgi:hypothetical protein
MTEATDSTKAPISESFDVLFERIAALEAERDVAQNDPNLKDCSPAVLKAIIAFHKKRTELLRAENTALKGKYDETVGVMRAEGNRLRQEILRIENELRKLEDAEEYGNEMERRWDAAEKHQAELDVVITNMLAMIERLKAPVSDAEKKAIAFRFGGGSVANEFDRIIAARPSTPKSAAKENE